MVDGDYVSLEPYTEEGHFYCDVTGTGAGTATIRATCDDDTYAEKEILVTSNTRITSVTFSDLYDQNTIVDGDEIDLDDNNIQIRFDKGSGGSAPQYYTNGFAVRLYAKSTLTVHSANENVKTINSIKFYQPSSSPGTNSMSSDVETLDWGNREWGNTTGEDVTSVTLTEGGTSGNVRFTGIEVTYTTNEE